MKNAMKKLMSLLLVAVLLVSAIPFAALAAEDEISFATGNSVAASAAPAAENQPAGQSDEISFSTSNPVAKTQVDPNNQVAIAVVFNACAGCGVESKTINTKVEPGTKAWKVARELQGKSSEEWNALSEKYNIAYDVTEITSSTNTLTVTITEKPVVLKNFLITVKIDGTDLSGDKAIQEGTVLKLDASLLSDFGVAMPEGKVINMFKEVTYKNGAAVIGDVISGTYTVKKDAEILVITVPGTGSNTNNNNTNNNNTNGSNNAGGSQATTGTYTVKFMAANGTDVLHTTESDANGKLAAIDVNYASMLVKAPSGYTFSDRWKKNNTGDSIATSTIINELTITADTTFVPVFTAVKSDTITSTKNQNDIFLNIFVNRDFNNCKTIKLNDHWVISDDKITTSEILNYVVTDYYKAADSNKGLQADGLYYSVGSFMYNWLTDSQCVQSIDDIAAKRANGTVTINIMVTNAAVKSGTAAADSSNPKTGDSIYTAIAVMGISAASLAAVMYFYNKKRMAI